MASRKSISERLRKYALQYLNSKTVFAIDCLSSLYSSAILLLVAAFFARENGFFRGYFAIWWTVGAIVGSIISCFVCKFYKVLIRHMQIRDLLKMFDFGLLKMALMAIALLVGKRLTVEAIILLFVDFLLTSFILVSVRLVMIVSYDVFRNHLNIRRTTSRVLVYGLSEKAVSIITRLMQSPHYQVVGFLAPADNVTPQYRVAELKVYGYSCEEDFRKIASNLSLDYVLFAREEDARQEKKQLVDFCLRAGVKILIAPSINEISSDDISTRKMREIKIEDLLGRDEIKIDNFERLSDAHGKTILITGAAGSIGSEMCRQLARYGVSNLILFDNAETPMHNLRLELEDKFPHQSFVPVIGDVRMIDRLDFVFKEHHPDIVFHAAAYKHVPLMEENPCEAVLANIVGSRNVADKCIEYGCEKMVMISTDKAVNPTNVMGCTKRLAEIYVQSLGLAIGRGEIEGKTKFVTTRFGNVLGSNGSVIPRFTEQIAKGGPVTVTDPRINRFFMTIPEACRLVLEASVISEGNQICIFDMGEPVLIDDLARKMIELAGLTVGKDIKITYTGLRPGEKLYEEVLSNAENTEPTSHERIRIARVREYDYSEAVAGVTELEELARKVDIPGLVTRMKQIVPEFVSNNSPYSVYDTPTDTI